VPLVSSFSNTFVFSEFGGTSSLLPGRPLSQSVDFTPPAVPGVGWHVNLQGFRSSFVHPNSTLTQRPLGQLQIFLGLAGRSLTTLVCRVRLTDENMDDAIIVRVFANVIFIT
jgi:hypothetical protein